jgi:hypothetical protein
MKILISLLFLSYLSIIFALDFWDAANNILQRASTNSNIKSKEQIKREEAVKTYAKQLKQDLIKYFNDKRTNKILEALFSNENKLIYYYNNGDYKVHFNEEYIKMSIRRTQR